MDRLPFRSEGMTLRELKLEYSFKSYHESKEAKIIVDLLDLIEQNQMVDINSLLIEELDFEALKWDLECAINEVVDNYKDGGD